MTIGGAKPQSGTEPFLQGPVAENYASWNLRFSVDGIWSPSGFSHYLVLSCIY